jgi:hypothetical protein
MRTISLLFVIASCGALFAGSHSETTTYVDGNLTGVSPNTGGTLTFDDDKAMYLRTGLENVAVPYAGVSHAELGAVKETSHDVPFYKFWAMHHHAQKTETQLLIVNFKNDAGEDKTMTLELAQPAAASVLSDLETRTGKTFSATAKPAQAVATNTPATPAKKHDPMSADRSSLTQGENWWGDSWWKTPRNADKWNKPASGGDSTKPVSGSDQTKPAGGGDSTKPPTGNDQK